MQQFGAVQPEPPRCCFGCISVRNGAIALSILYVIFAIIGVIIFSTDFAAWENKANQFNEELAIRIKNGGTGTGLKVARAIYQKESKEVVIQKVSNGIKETGKVEAPPPVETMDVVEEPLKEDDNGKIQNAVNVLVSLAQRALHQGVPTMFVAGISFTIMSGVIAALSLYGIFKNKPTYLLPQIACGVFAVPCAGILSVVTLMVGAISAYLSIGSAFLHILAYAISAALVSGVTWVFWQCYAWMIKTGGQLSHWILVQGRGEEKPIVTTPGSYGVEKEGAFQP